MDVDPQVELNRYCAKRNKSYKFRLISKTGPPHDPWFTCHVFVENENLGEGTGRTKKAAEKVAARLALASLQSKENPTEGQPDSEAFRLDSVRNALHASVANGQSSVNSATNHSTIEFNYIKMLNELCQKKGWHFSFLDVDRIGPSHNPQFFCVAEIRGQKYPEGNGKNKKQARKKAAFLALQKLKMDIPDDDVIPTVPADYVGESGSENSSVSGSTGGRSTGRWNTSSEPTPPTITDSEKSSSSTSTMSTIASNNPFREFDNVTSLNSGGFGDVFKARKILDKRYYAVKKVKLRNEKAISEVQTLAGLEHPNIVRYYHSWMGENYFYDRSYSHSNSSETDIGQEFLYIQMEWCEAGDLKTWIKHMKTVDKKKSLDIFRQIVEGVVYIHSENLIHRDLKPANIFFAKGMKIKIGDFGLVTPMTGEHDSHALTRTRDTGTPSYMAPEQHENKYENEVDIFALGLILIELFWIFGTGHEKYTEWKKIRHSQLPEKFDEKYPSEESIIKLMLSEDPKKRPSARFLKNYFEEKDHLDSITR